MKKKPLSLTLQLFLSICALNIVTMIVIGVLGLRSANINISEEYDAQLLTEASMLWEILEEWSKKEPSEGLPVEAVDAEHTTPLLERIEQDSLLDYAQWRAFRVWKDGAVIMHSDNTDAMPPGAMSQGFSQIAIGKNQWRVFSLHDPLNGIIVETFENLHNRDILQRDILLDVLGPLAIMLPLLGLLFSFAVKLGLRGLHKLTHRFRARAPYDFSRLESGDIPSELEPLVGAVNSLLSTLESSLAHEREFIDHAAHELRTPLSALKLQAQLLAKSLKDTQSQSALDELLASVDRTARLVDQLLLLSRVAQQTISLEPVNVHNLIREAIGMVAIRIVDKHINLSLSSDETLTVEAQPELLRILIGTILDNAIKYTPAGRNITISAERRSQLAWIAITDSGEGIPESERDKVFDRFYRMPHTRQSGSGLGLAIASQIAQMLRAAITLETPDSGHGLRVIIAL